MKVGGPVFNSMMEPVNPISSIAFLSNQEEFDILEAKFDKSH